MIFASLVFIYLVFYLIKCHLGFASILLYVSLQPFGLVSLLMTVGFLQLCHSLFELSFDINRCLSRALHCHQLESNNVFQ